MKDNNPTMVDVGRLAGCSQSTVSLVLNSVKGSGISEETKKRVMEAADALGYEYRLCREPEDRGAEVIALLLDGISTSQMNMITMESVVHEGLAKGLQSVVIPVDNTKTHWDASLDLLKTSRLRGIIYSSIMTRSIEINDAVTRLGAPIVLLNCYEESSRFPSVLPAEQNGGYRAARHLLERGHRRIAFVSGEMWMEAARSRRDGYRNALAERGIPWDPELFIPGDWRPQSAHAGTLKLLERAPDVTGIVCSNDFMAFGVYEALKELGLSIPGDISVTGYDNLEFSGYLDPPLTTVHLPHSEMGGWGVERLCSQHISATGAISNITNRFYMECPLIVRESVSDRKDES